MGLLNSLDGETRTQGMCLDRWTNHIIGNKKSKSARKGRTRARPESRHKQKIRHMAKARSRTGELNVATWNACSLSLTGRRRPGHFKVLLQKCEVLGCDVIGSQETRRLERTEFTAAGYRVFCSGEDGSSGRTGQHEGGASVQGVCRPRSYVDTGAYE